MMKQCNLAFGSIRARRQRCRGGTWRSLLSEIASPSVLELSVMRNVIVADPIVKPDLGPDGYTTPRGDDNAAREHAVVWINA